MGWAHEIAAWFALVEGRYEDVIDRRSLTGWARPSAPGREP
ncbi:hypothetical protein AB0B45_22115 [Nonomuraea sp. NPDC049152]